MFALVLFLGLESGLVIGGELGLGLCTGLGQGLELRFHHSGFRVSVMFNILPGFGLVVGLISGLGLDW